MEHYKVNRDVDGIRISEEHYDLRYLEKTESIFAQANGTFGIRASLELPALGGEKGFFVAGLFGKKDGEVTELINGPDILSFRITVDEEPVTLDGAEIIGFQRKLNPETAELKTEAKIRLKSGKTMTFRSRRFPSFRDTRLFSHEVTIIMAEKSSLHLETGIDGRTSNAGVSYFTTPKVRVHHHRIMDFQTYTKKNQLRLLSTVKFNGKESGGFFVRRRSLFTEYEWKAKPGIPYVFHKVSIIEEEENRIPENLDKTYERLFEEHLAVYEKVKQDTRIVIEGISEREEAAIMLSRYHLLGMGNRENSDVSIGAKGLTGEGYKGHVFWDTEIYLLPFYSFHMPSIAHNLLRYRALRGEGAREKAKEYGLKGAMYPWESADSGREETPLYSALNIHTGEVTKVWSGIKEHHVTADIIYGLWQYYLVTGDEVFMNEYGYEMIAETADFWASRAEYDENRDAYVIRDVIGPDEYTEHVDNNAYTNYMAHFVLSLAVKTHENRGDKISVKESEVKTEVSENRLHSWEKVMEKLYLPAPDATGIIAQDDSFLNKPRLDSVAVYRDHDIRQMILKDFSREEVVDMQVLKQADLVMLFTLFPDKFRNATVSENISFYGERTIHDSSLSYCAHAQASAGIGSAEKGLQYFRNALNIDFNDNYKDATDGIHAAAQGGIWKSLVLGFAGINVEEGKVFINPHLPRSWKSMSFSLVVQGHKLSLKLSQKNVVIESIEQGNKGLRFLVEGKEFTFTGDRLEVSRGSV